jgi:hypothetical protein
MIKEVVKEMGTIIITAVIILICIVAAVSFLIGTMF